MIIGIDCSRAFTENKTGTENYSYYLVRHLLRLPTSAQHIFVLFIRPNAAIPDWVGQKNVHIRLINFPFLWTQIGLAMDTWKNPLDVLWIPAHTLPLLRKPGLKTVVTIHGLEYRWLPEYKNLLQRWYLPLSTQYAVRSAGQLIAVSQFTAKQLTKELHTPSEKIKVIHEGVEYSVARIAPSFDKQTLEQYGLEAKKYILFVGTVQPRKNLVALVAAFSQIASRLPDHKLVIAGGIGWMARDVLCAPSKYGIQEKVIFTGRVSDTILAALYGSASIYVQPSITEGFGLPILEAMKAGVPVICSDGGALPEVVGDAGIVVSLKNDSSFHKESFFVTHLAKAILQLAGDTKQRQKYIAMGYSRVKQFSWNRAAKATFNTLMG